MKLFIVEYKFYVKMLIRAEDKEQASNIFLVCLGFRPPKDKFFITDLNQEEQLVGILMKEYL